MKKLRVAVLSVILALMLALFALSPGKVRATGYTFDFTVSDQGFVLTDGDSSGCDNPGRSPPTGTYNSGVGWESQGVGGSAWMCIYKDLGASISIHSLEIVWNAGASASAGTRGVALVAGTTGVYSTNLSTSSGPHTDTFTGLSVTADHIRLLLDTNGDPSTNTAYQIFINFDELTPTPTGTLSPTPTLGPAPTSEAGGGGSFEGQCVLLGDDSSVFMTLPGAWTLDPPTLGHGSPNTGLRLETGQASLVLNLNKYHKYQIILRFHTEDGEPGDRFSWKLGSTLETVVTVVGTTDEQTFVTDSDGQNYEPDNPTAADIYTFVLKELIHTSEDTGTLVIDLACIEDRTPDVQLVPEGGENTPPGTCTSCDYNPTGNLLNDLMGVFGWLWCGLSQIWDCVLKPLLLGLWKTVVDIFRWLNFARMWADLIWSNLGTWLGSAWTIATRWLVGTINNLLVAAGNLVFAFFNSDLGAFLVNAIGAILFNPLSALIANTAHTVQTAAGAAVDIVHLGAYYIGLIFGAVLNILGAIPEIFVALVNGFNASPTAIPVWAPTCNSANTFLYYPCLGSYILDNTLLDGPAYLMFILLLGLVAVNTVLWTVRQVQEALTK